MSNHQKRFLLAIALLLLLKLAWSSHYIAVEVRNGDGWRGSQISENAYLLPRSIPYLLTSQVLADISGLGKKILWDETKNSHYYPNGKIKVGLAGEIGIAQFMPATWKWFNGLRGTNLDIYSEKDQLDMLEWALKNGYASHWTCVKQGRCR